MTTTTKHRRFASQRVEFETLEGRQLLTAFGTPWPEARALTISFPADGTAIGEYPSQLRETLDAVAARESWQELALRAFQTWAVHADINVGLRNDHNLDFGTPGLMVADPRFGDFRIGAVPQPGALANVVPFQAIAGTYAGDLMLNSEANYRYHDWSDGIGPDPSTQQPDQWDLFSVLLHESGNALGLDDNSLDWTVMFRQYTVPKGILSQADINGIQALYGARTDPFESVSNDQLAVSSVIPTPIGFQPASDVIEVAGSLVDAADVDYYEFTPVSGEHQVTISLQASGISLVKTRVEILDATGQTLAESVAGSAFENDHEFNLHTLHHHPLLYIRVSAADQDVFSVGDYRIRLDYRDAAAKSADIVPASFDAGVDSLYTNFALADTELGENDTLATHDLMPQALGVSTPNRFEVESAVSAATDVDVFKISAPATASDRLLIHLNSLGTQQPDLRVRVIDATGAAVGVLGRLDANGMWTIELAQVQASADYFIRISVDPNSAVGVGNYVAVAEFVTPSEQMNDLSSGDVSSSVDDFVLWTARKSKLFRFDLGVQGSANSEAVQLTIYDAHTHEVRMVLSSQSDRTRSAFAWLTEGDYILRFSAVSRVGLPINNVAYQLTAEGISDDQNPGGDPDNTAPEYYYDDDYYYPDDPGVAPDDPDNYYYYYDGYDYGSYP